jgi:hypothetical protein
MHSLDPDPQYGMKRGRKKWKRIARYNIFNKDEGFSENMIKVIVRQRSTTILIVGFDGSHDYVIMTTTEETIREIPFI